MGATPPLLDPAHAAFIQSGVSIVAASRDRETNPTLVRAIACKVSPDRQRVTVFLSRRQAGTLLADVAASRVLAVVFSQPSTHRTIQLKTVDAAEVALATGDVERMAEHARLVTADLKRLGHGDELLSAYFSYSVEDVAALAFTPSAAFTQTPGPGAGAPLGGGGP
jgi:hypothetical protein